MDDCFSIIEGDESTVSELFKYINSLNSHIQFTFESSKMRISFLDLNIHLNTTSHKLDFSLFVKPSSKDIFLNYNSAHPKNVIVNSAKNEIHRAINNSSNAELQEQSIDIITNMLHKNDYPPNVVTKLVNETISNVTKMKTDKQNNEKITFLSLPYINEQTCRKVYYTLRKHNKLESTRVTFTSGRRLVDILTKSSLQHTACNKQNDNKCYQCDRGMNKKNCYQLTCNVCEKRYIGETGRFKRHRNWEHYKSVRDYTRATAMGKHYLTDHPYMPMPREPYKFTTRQKCKDYVDRQLWQSTLIKREFPELNTQLSEIHTEGEWVKNTWKLM